MAAWLRPRLKVLALAPMPPFLPHRVLQKQPRGPPAPLVFDGTAQVQPVLRLGVRYLATFAGVTLTTMSPCLPPTAPLPQPVALAEIPVHEQSWFGFATAVPAASASTVKHITTTSFALISGSFSRKAPAVAWQLGARSGAAAI